MHDGERRNRVRVMRRFKNIVFKFDEAGGKAAHKGIAGPGGVDHFYFMRADAEKDVRLGDKTAASAQGDDNDGDLEATAELMQSIR